MALWPFRRKSRRKWGRAPTFADVEDLRGRKSGQPLPPRSLTVPETIAEVTGVKARPSLKKRGTEPKKLQRRQRSYSFSPDRPESIHVERKKSRRGKHGAAPVVAAPSGADVARRRTRGKDGYGGGDHEKGWQAFGDDTFARVPTLHNKRDGEHLMPRKMSSKKRRRNDQEREAEIKAMSNFVPVRPAAEDWTAGRPMKKDSKRVKIGLGLGFGGGSKNDWDRMNRSSDVSLPTPESIHSSLSTDSEYVSFKVSALEALAPRPTLRYAVYPRWGPTTTESGSGPMRMPSQRRKLSERGPIPEATLKAHKRVDDLADDLDASDLRELMERDQRRREKRRQTDQDKMERRLARRAEKQRAAEGDRPPMPNLERGVLGREAVGLGINPASAVVTSSKRRATDEPPKDQVPAGDEMDHDSRHQPLEAFHRTTSIPLETPFPTAKPEEPVPPVPRSPKMKRFLRSKTSRSKSPTASDEKLQSSMDLRKRSGSSTSRGPLSWTSSIFRWVSRHKRSTGGPSSFSNTSRDSMAINQLPTPAVNSLNSVNSIAAHKLSRGVPRRTMSRFREDLPELPLSPPDSRNQSPEAQPIPIPSTIIEASPAVGSQPENITFGSLPQAQRSGETTPRTSVRRSIEESGPTPSTISRADGAEVSPQPHSMSLASIDSEGSWLSGRLRKRRSSGIPDTISVRVQHSLQEERSSNNSPTAESNGPGDDVSIVDDEYLSRFARTSHERSAWNRKSTGEARPSSDEGEDARWGEVAEQHPTVVHAASRMKSREGILNSLEDDESEDGEDEDGAVPDLRKNDSGLQRATSVNLGKNHARNFSAGSAKLLELSPRASTDGNRTSTDIKL
jgi:hypothetical protein